MEEAAPVYCSEGVLVYPQLCAFGEHSVSCSIAGKTSFPNADEPESWVNPPVSLPVLSPLLYRRGMLNTISRISWNLLSSHHTLITGPFSSTMPLTMGRNELFRTGAEQQAKENQSSSRSDTAHPQPEMSLCVGSSQRVFGSSCFTIVTASLNPILSRLTFLHIPNTPAWESWEDRCGASMRRRLGGLTDTLHGLPRHRAGRMGRYDTSIFPHAT